MIQLGAYVNNDFFSYKVLAKDHTLHTPFSLLCHPVLCSRSFTQLSRANSEDTWGYVVRAVISSWIPLLSVQVPNWILAMVLLQFHCYTTIQPGQNLNLAIMKVQFT